MDLLVRKSVAAIEPSLYSDSNGPAHPRLVLEVRKLSEEADATASVPLAPVSESSASRATSVRPVAFANQRNESKAAELSVHGKRTSANE